MRGFDPRSFVIISAALGLLLAPLFFILRRSVPRDIGGLTPWAWGCLVMVPAAFLFAMRGTLPVLWSSFVANVLLVAGIILFYAGLRRLAGQPVSARRMAIVLTALAAALVWPTFIDDDYRLRVLLVSSVNAMLFFSSALVILRMPHQSFAEPFSIMAFGFAGCISFLRSVAALFQPGFLEPQADTSPVQQVYIATFAFSLVAVSLGFLLMVNRRRQRQLEHAAAHDLLTGVWRREAVLDTVRREMARAVRYGRPLAILMIDLDNFKAINDDYGHLAGDRVIVDFAHTAQKALRSHDVIGRFGGEEFIVVLPDSLLDDAMVVADRIRTECEQRRLDALPPYTVSIGVATLCGSEDNMHGLVGRADQALYAAKRAGKNRIEAGH